MTKQRTTPEPPPMAGARWIPLTKGLFALVDDADYGYVSNFTWTAMRCDRADYAYYIRRKPGGKDTFLLHRVIMNAPAGMEVDHIDGDGLNCRRYNLRICTRSQNRMNQRVRITPKLSIYKGVTFDKSRDKWCARIKYFGVTRNLGRFEHETDAAIAYNVAASKTFGEFARLNQVCV